MKGPPSGTPFGWCYLMGTGWQMNKQIDQKILMERMASFQENDNETSLTLEMVSVAGEGRGGTGKTEELRALGRRGG